MEVCGSGWGGNASGGGYFSLYYHEPRVGGSILWCCVQGVGLSFGVVKLNKALAVSQVLLSKI